MCVWVPRLRNVCYILWSIEGLGRREQGRKEGRKEGGNGGGGG